MLGPAAPSCFGSSACTLVGQEQGASQEVPQLPGGVWSWGFVCTHLCADTRSLAWGCEAGPMNQQKGPYLQFAC